MSNSAFSIAGAAIKDMSDTALAETVKKLEADQLAVQNNLNTILGQMQLVCAMVNVIKFEIDRRANSIAVARIFPH